MEHVSWYRSIQFRISLIILLTLLIPSMGFWNYFHSFSRNNLLEQSSNAMHTALYGSSLMMQSTMDEVSNFSRKISQDSELLYLAQSYQSEGVESDRHEQIRSQISLLLNEYVGQLRTLESIYLFFEDSKTVVTTLPEQKEFSYGDSYGNQIYQLYYNVFQSPIEWRTLPSPDGINATLSFIRPLSAVQGDGKCILICNLKDSAWKPALEHFEPESSIIYISDYSGNVLLSSKGLNIEGDGIGEEDGFKKAFHSGENQGSYSYGAGTDRNRITYYNALESGLKYISVVPEYAILQDAAVNRTFYTMMALCCILSMLGGNLALFHFVIKPVRLLKEHMRNAELGRLEPITSPQSKDELGALVHSYNHMIARLSQLIDEVYIQQLMRKQAQLSFLQSQMDEHFMFNTLNTIYGEACHERADSSARMILTLSKYFRLSLSYGEEKLPLDQIADLLRLYLQLQRMRFGPALQCHIEQFQDMGDYVALKYLFQPIVENAIVHGLEKNFENHYIHIVFKKEKDMLYFEVSDDGAGIPLQQLERECATSLWNRFLRIPTPLTATKSCLGMALAWWRMSATWEILPPTAAIPSAPSPTLRVPPAFGPVFWHFTADDF